MALFGYSITSKNKNYTQALDFRVSTVRDLIELHNKLTKLNENSRGEPSQKKNYTSLLDQFKGEIIKYNTQQLKCSIKMKKILRTLLNYDGHVFPYIKHHHNWGKIIDGTKECDIRFSDNITKNLNAKLLYGSDHCPDPFFYFAVFLFFCPLLAVYFVVSFIKARIDICAFHAEVPHAGCFVDDPNFKAMPNSDTDIAYQVREHNSSQTSHYSLG